MGIGATQHHAVTLNRFKFSIEHT